MADGIDQAVDPGSAPTERRDARGRFTPKAETMFAPRQVEGDPLTGDVSDGGDDARLAQHERDVADGRAERDSKPPPRRAPVREEEEGGTPEQIGDGEEREQEQEEGEERPDGGEGEGEAASKFKITTADGQPVSKFEVMVDGAPVEVTLDEALSGYIKEKTFHQRMNKVAEARQAVDAQSAEVAQWRDTYLQRLQALDRELATLTPEEPDWDKEFAADPTPGAANARARQKAYQAIYAKRAQIAQEQERTQQEARAAYDKRTAEYAVQQFSEFVAESKIPDEKALRERLARMRSYGLRMGFTEAELATVFDKRMLKVLDHGAQHDLATTAPIKAVIPGKGKTLTPGVATPVGNATRRHIDEAQQRLARSGRLDDAAEVFSRLL